MSYFFIYFIYYSIRIKNAILYILITIIVLSVVYPLPFGRDCHMQNMHLIYPARAHYYRRGIPFVENASPKSVGDIFKECNGKEKNAIFVSIYS